MSLDDLLCPVCTLVAMGEKNDRVRISSHRYEGGPGCGWNSNHELL